MSILVTGGAGYIGSVAVDDLHAKGERVVVIDNLVYGHRSAVHLSIPFYQASIGDRPLVESLIREHDVTEIMHFSAYAYVGESVELPGKYYENNVVETARLLEAASNCGVDTFIFSSTCATFGEPEYTPIDESHPQNPTNPYGWSKLFVEKMLEGYEAAHGMRYVCLRYFNAAGATESRGEHHVPETHLIPLALEAAAGERESVSIFGTDYPTRDGTAVRDYIHVSDISAAHLLALEYLRSGGVSEAFNLGNGNGFSVAEVIDAARSVTGSEITALESERRPGDPSELIADASKAGEVLGWKPQIPKIEDIIESAWKWKLEHPEGYED